MHLILSRKNAGEYAECEYDPNTKKVIVYKGAKVSNGVSSSETFKAGEKIIELRKKYIVNGVLVQNIEFLSASTAANFITGCSTNGMLAWKNKDGVNLKTILFKMGIN